MRRGIPSVHCGTEGAAASVQAVAKGMEPYGKAADVETKKVPVCTVKEFPYKAEHVVQWVREEWDSMWDKSARELFVDPVRDVLERHPEGSKDEDGEEFWSGTRRGEAAKA